MIRSQLKTAILIFIVFTIITGLIYPLFITGISQILFSKKADGSLIYKNGKCIGSKLIGQKFTNPKYFWGRPSATVSFPYNASASGGSNLGPLNPKLISEVKKRINQIRKADPSNKNSIPVDLVTSSASGLDPDISIAAAYYQIPRVAQARGLPTKTVKSIVKKYTTRPLFGIIGYPVVNILEVNLALNKIRTKK
jgi:K+-transporting ATPase ATPase C chain